MQYDLILPFGTSCAASDILRSQGMQYYSYPFDWTGGGTIETRTQILINGFTDWLNAEDLIQIAPLDPNVVRKFKDYKNIKTGMTFRHMFTTDKSHPKEFNEEYEPVIKTAGICDFLTLTFATPNI